MPGAKEIFPCVILGARAIRSSALLQSVRKPDTLRGLSLHSLVRIRNYRGNVLNELPRSTPIPRSQKEVPWICLLHLSNELLLLPSRSTSLFYVPAFSHECWCCNYVITFACDKLFGLVDICRETCCCGVTIVISTHLVSPECPIFCAIVKQRNSDECC